MDPLQRLVAAGRVTEDVPLGPLTTYGLGGRARYVVEVAGVADLSDAFAFARSHNMPIVALGRGSNIVVADEGFAGIVLRPGPELNHHRIEDDGVVVAGAGMPLPLLARESVRAGRGGLEFYTGIPGSVGGAVRMNAGCHGSETSDVLRHALVFDATAGAAGHRTPADLEHSYRHSNLGDTDFVIEAEYETRTQEAEEGERLIREIGRWRRQNQPGGTRNAGSIFKNPPGDAAGRIIDDLGLKGLSRGLVSVSDRHGNFFEAAPGATAADMHRLVIEVRERVLAETGIALEPEVRFLGSFA